MNTKEEGFMGARTTLASIAQDMVDVLSMHVADADQVAQLCDKLKTYRVVHTHTTLHRGKHVRWLRKGSPSEGWLREGWLRKGWLREGGRPTLSLGGVVVDVRPEEGGDGDGDAMVHILTYARRSMQYAFDNYVTFQKLTDQEMLVLLVQEQLT